MTGITFSIQFHINLSCLMPIQLDSLVLDVTQFKNAHAAMIYLSLSLMYDSFC